MLQAFLDQLIEAHRVHEKGTEDAVHHLVWDACISQCEAVNAIAGDRVFMFWLQNNTRNV
jgi:hypothetical protein